RNLKYGVVFIFIKPIRIETEQAERAVIGTKPSDIFGSEMNNRGLKKQPGIDDVYFISTCIRKKGTVLYATMFHLFPLLETFGAVIDLSLLTSPFLLQILMYHALRKPELTPRLMRQLFFVLFMFCFYLIGIVHVVTDVVLIMLTCMHLYLLILTMICLSWSNNIFFIYLFL
ncbi:hypothetical protein ACJX0J_036617, partial [Zea mays]